MDIGLPSNRVGQDAFALAIVGAFEGDKDFGVEVFRGTNLHQLEISVDRCVWIYSRNFKVNLNFYGKSSFGEYVLRFPNISKHRGRPARSCPCMTGM